MKETIDLPVDLVVLCYSELGYDSEEGRLFLPPEEIFREIAQTLSTGVEPSPLLTGWIATQQKVAEEARQLAEALPEFDGLTMPGWMGSKWAIQLGCPWAAGLADAVAEGKAWLAENQ